MKHMALFVLCIILAACAALRENTTELAGTRWMLESLNGHQLRPKSIITLEFDDRQMRGTAGCNDYGALYTIEPENVLKVGEGSVTEMLCTEPAGVMEQENEYTNAWFKVNSYKVVGTTLSLMNEQAGVLLQYKLLPKFKVNSNNLLGKTWQLASASDMEGTNLSAFTLRFDRSTYSGTTSCRNYQGSYLTDQDTLRFPSMGMTTEVNCIQEQLQAEGTYTSLLGTVWQYNVSDTQLELYTDRGKKLVFSAGISYPNGSSPRPTPSPVATEVLEGDLPIYVNVSECPPGARVAIENKRLPENLIHSCQETPGKLDTGEMISLVSIQYGEGMDCPAGCIYDSYIGVLISSRTLVDLPSVSMETAMWGHPPLNQWRTWSIQDYALKSRQEVAQRAGYYGWVLKLDDFRFTKMYFLSYGNDAKIRRTLYTATGEIFVYLDWQGREVWDFSRFDVVTRELR
jgi:heat shock protein HslJ